MESAAVSGIAKCSSSAILPCIGFPPPTAQLRSTGVNLNTTIGAGSAFGRSIGMDFAIPLLGRLRCPIPGRRRGAFAKGESHVPAPMNTHQTYTLASPPPRGRFLGAWAVLSRGTFSGAIFLIDIAMIVAMSCFTGIAYHLVAYG